MFQQYSFWSKDINVPTNNISSRSASSRGAIFTKKYNNNNSIQFFIIYVPCQQPQDQLQTQHSVDKSNYIMDKQHIAKD
jgi:hypothetical protein